MKVFFKSLPGVIFLLFSGVSFGGPELPPSLEKLRVILVIDQHAKLIGQGVKKDGELMESLLAHIFRNKDFPRLQTKQVTTKRFGDDGVVRRSDISHYFDENPVGEDEAILFYFSGHGAFHPNIDGGHILQLSAAKSPASEEKKYMARWQLRDFLDSKTQSPLRIIITDACASIIDEKEVKKYVARAETTLAKSEIEDFYEALFFRHRGTMDFTSSSPGQPSWTDNEGSLMTLVLTETLKAPPLRSKALDSNEDDFVSWRELFEYLQKDTSVYFKKIQKDVVFNLEQEIPAILKAKDQMPFLFSVADVSPSFVNNFYIRLDVEKEGVKGMEIIRGFEVSELRDQPLQVVIQFYDEQHMPIGNSVNEYQYQKHFAIAESFTPKSDRERVPGTSYRFFPYSKFIGFPPEGSRKSFWADLKIIEEKTDKIVAQSLPYPFSLPPKDYPYLKELSAPVPAP